ncbi:hypothetical protein WN55_10081 [Dufourea novaeangliae]|uniref:Uncharacterized protein n=1 Tax=Dufourea novaeangliae TaxID=178035 RepID=A0A154P7L8_DUFNO|nr:hypothetical protein WN55_10081 [Dufourea novaeangliae]
MKEENKSYGVTYYTWLIDNYYDTYLIRNENRINLWTNRIIYSYSKGVLNKKKNLKRGR